MRHEEELEPVQEPIQEPEKVLVPVPVPVPAPGIGFQLKTLILPFILSIATVSMVAIVFTNKGYYCTNNPLVPNPPTTGIVR